MNEREGNREFAERIERIASRLGELAREFGFASTEEMRRIASGLSSENMADVLVQWRARGEYLLTQIPRHDPSQVESWNRGKFGLMLEQVRLTLKAGGPVDEMVISLEDAIDYAYGLRYQEVIPELEEMAARLGEF
jgi:hypothetical protein